MKLKLLSFFLFCFSIAVAKSTENPPTGAAIGLKMNGLMGPPNYVQFYFSVKNTGTETLTNVYITEAPGTTPIMYNFTPIASLAPGEVVMFNGYKYGALCYDISQTIVHATTSDTSVITDLSSDPTNYEIVNGYPEYGSYYNDIPTQSFYSVNVSATENAVYQDLNGNSIVDVGDCINYTYEVNSIVPYTIIDDNAIVNPTQGLITTGIHYLTNSDINIGYVYNNSYVVYTTECFTNDMPFIDDTPCYSCPNPGYNIVTKITDLTPHTISGKVKLNNNNDNCATGVNFPNRRIAATNNTNTFTSFTNTSGDYYIMVPNMSTNYDILASIDLNSHFTSNPSSTNVSTYNSVNPIDYNNNNFCIGSIGNYTNLSVGMFKTNEAIPGNIANYKIHFTNNGSTNLSGSIQLTFDNGKLTLSNAYPAQNSATANTLTWNYTNLLPFESRYIDLAFTVSTTAIMGSSLPFSVIANPIAGDDYPSDNTFTWNQTVRSSFDPNDKTVIEGRFIDIGQTNDYLNYVTQFQNTGTANATTVVIKETLDSKLDWDTFEPIASSHNANIQIRNGNEVTYTFSNINLPYESANEPASHGWMAYRIKPKATIALWDIMSSSSAIYFDYNPPIYTNTVTTQVTALATTNFIKNNFSVYPNPATSFITIEAKTNVDANYEIIDINGKSLLKGTIQSLQPINIATLQSGFYFVTIKTEQEKTTYKLIKN
ncbi:T9SS type A sorting domain-containing protein [Flavobacterium sp. N1994]|uniref:T9SS type A sorting domain-containing protein n=1 Tax=Flavobacterium sp. N1994 TaxID=2986827 RepID=UPI002222EC94|nr:T9SS type A sorting domain-containing protein [Flavobacterium sp. N1994]